jgi:hypothetical protein
VRRALLYVMVFAIVVLAVAMVSAIGRANTAADRADAAIAEIDRLRAADEESALALQVGCGRANVAREGLHWLYTEKLADAEVVAAEAMSAEIRARFVRSVGETTKRLEALNVRPDAYPDPDRPWLVDCKAAYPAPAGPGGTQQEEAP